MDHRLAWGMRISIGSLCMATPDAAMAQEQAPAPVSGSVTPVPAPEEMAENDIVVTAQRRSERLQDVPMAVTALGGDSLQRAPVSNISDLQTSVPNVNISLRNGSGVVAIRGIGYDIVTSGADGSVAIHSDGVYASRPAAALSSLFDMERIEVARGPQGTLYGRNATGGAINIISRRPTSEPEGYLDLSYGNYNALSVEGAVSGPIVGDKLLARVAAKVEQRDGWGTNVFNGRDVDDVRSRAVRGMVELRPSETVSFLVIGDYFKRDDSANAYHFVGCVAPICNPNAAVNRGFTVPNDPRDVDQDIQAGFRPEQYGLSLTTKIELPFADLTAISGYRDGKSYFIGDFDATAQLGSFITREEDYQTFSQELQLGSSSEKIDWIVGGFYFNEKNYARANGAFPPFQAPALGALFQGGTLFTDAYAIFGEASYHLGPKLTFTLGGRYSKEKKHLRDEFTFTNGPRNTVARQSAPTATIPCVVCRGLPDRANFDAFTPKFGAQYKFSSSQMIYVNVQKGFKSGGFAIGAVTPAFNPETIWSYEAGLKAEWFDRALSTNVSLYHYDYRNLQVGQIVGVGTVITNAGAARVDGVEAEARLKLGNLSIDGFGAYNHARFTSYVAANPAINVAVPLNLSGNLLSNAPKWTGKVGAEYGAPLSGGTLVARGELFTSSRVYFSPFNNVTNSQRPYTLLNANLRYEGEGGWYAGIFMTNIADRLVRSGSIVSSAAAGAFVAVQYLPPRTFGLKVGKNF